MTLVGRSKGRSIENGSKVGGEARLIAPGLRPGAEPLSPLRMWIGGACLMTGLAVAIVGSLIPMFWWLIAVGSAFVIAGLIVLRACGFGRQQPIEDADPRKLYGVPKA